MAAVSPLVALSSALLEVVPKGPDLVPFAQSSTQADALFPPEALVVAASDRASDYTGAARAAAWTAESRRRPGRGPKALHEPELLAAIDQAKVDLMHWRSREAITDHINDSYVLSKSSIGRACSCTRQNGPYLSSDVNPHRSRRFRSFALGPRRERRLLAPHCSAGRPCARSPAVARTHFFTGQGPGDGYARILGCVVCVTYLVRWRSLADTSTSELRQDCQKLLKEIQDMNDAHILAAEREMSGRQLSAVEASVCSSIFLGPS